MAPYTLLNVHRLKESKHFLSEIIFSNIRLKEKVAILPLKELTYCLHIWKIINDLLAELRMFQCFTVGTVQIPPGTVLYKSHTTPLVHSVNGLTDYEISWPSEGMDSADSTLTVLNASFCNYQGSRNPVF
jgi:hypothetical protein